MSLETFATSRALTLGVELELQLVSTHDYDLTPAAADLLRLLGKRKGPGSVVPEITDSMIELSTGICEDHADVLAQLTGIRDALVRAADKLGVALSGGGTHPFQDWSQRRIFDKPRFRQISELKRIVNISNLEVQALTEQHDGQTLTATFTLAALYAEKQDVNNLKPIEAAAPAANGQPAAATPAAAAPAPAAPANRTN